VARVLIADDDAAIRDVVRATCEIDAHEAQVVADAREAVDAFLHGRHDLMILDVNMPGGGAEQILERIEAAGATPSPVVVISGFTTAALDHPAIREIVQKPFGIDAMRQAIRTALGG
jgi:DNA-binding NtrC family response regulator